MTIRDSYEGGTPLGWAFFSNQKGALEFLAGCEIDIFDAIRAKRLDRLVALLEQDIGLLETTIGDCRSEHDATEHPLGYDWRTPLAHAVFLENPDAVRLLLDKGADPDVCGADGRSIGKIAVEEIGGKVGKLFAG